MMAKMVILFRIFIYLKKKTEEEEEEEGKEKEKKKCHHARMAARTGGNIIKRSLRLS